MSDMVERVAKVLFEKPGAGFEWAEATEFMKNRAREYARAAIEAMREPNNRMLHAAAKSMSPERRPTPKRVGVKEKHRIRYRAMIDAAIGQSEAQA